MIGRWWLKDVFDFPELPARLSLAGQLSSKPYLFREDGIKKEPRIACGLYRTTDSEGRLWIINAHPSKAGEYQRIDICRPKIIVKAIGIRI